MSRHRDQTDVSVEMASAFMVFLDGHQASEFSIGSTVWLQTNAVILSHSNQILLQFFNQLHITWNLVFGSKWMDWSKSVPGDGNHSDGRVKFKSAWTQRNHGISKSNILICQSLNVSHHLGLRRDFVELRLLHELRITLQFLNQSLVLSVFIEAVRHVVLSASLSFQLSKYLNDFI